VDGALVGAGVMVSLDLLMPIADDLIAFLFFLFRSFLFFSSETRRQNQKGPKERERERERSDHG
jgi:hypothetical protein